MASSNKETLKSQRHALYCTIAHGLQKASNSADADELLSRLQAVLEAEACLSCIDGDDGSVDDAAAPPAAAPAKPTPTVSKQPASSSPGALMSSALQQLKEELAHKVHQNMRQHQQLQTLQSLPQQQHSKARQQGGKEHKVRTTTLSCDPTTWLCNTHKYRAMQCTLPCSLFAL